MPDVANPIFAGNFRLQVLLPQDVRNPLGDLQDGIGSTTSDIEHPARGAGMLQHQTACPGDIVNADEISALKTILEYGRSIPVEEPGGEDCEHAGVGIGECLAGA